MNRLSSCSTQAGVAAVGMLLMATAGAAVAQTFPPRSAAVAAEDAVSTFHLLEGLRIELVAAEPDVVDPVAVRFDEHGRMWVVEMRDYPDGPAAGKTPQSRIRRLEDKDGDGRYETSATFASGLIMPTGLQPWQGGVIVTLAGRIAYFKDTTGDGRADVEETWYTGFATENSQLRANHPRFALDNRIYVANGLRGGDVVLAKQSGAPVVSLAGRDLRFDPARRAQYEAVSGNGQFGLTFDDFGQRFVSSNRNPLVHVVLENRYLSRGPRMAVPAVTVDVAASGADSRVYPLIDAWTTSNLHAGQFTAACGALIYRGDALPEVYLGAGFVCEPTGSLVHAEKLSPRGATFTSVPVAERREFLASTDPWFRPVNLEVGPDGELYVVDMYRAVIEHPDWMPGELTTRPDLLDGADRGRIWRVVAKDHPRRDSRQIESNPTAAGLVALLEHPNGWQRETAARLIYEQQDRSIADRLKAMVRDGRSAVARLRALWALDGLGLLDDETLRDALADGDGRVQSQAVRLSEPRLEADPNLRRIVWKLATAADPGLRFQVALSLAGVPGDETSAALAHIGLAADDCVWTRRAVALAAGDHALATWKNVVSAACDRDESEMPEGREELVRQLSTLVGSDPREQVVTAALETLFSSENNPHSRRLRQIAMLGLAGGLSQRRSSLADALAASAADVSRQIDQLFQEAAALAADPKARENDRALAIEILGIAPWKVARWPLEKLLSGDKSRTIRQRAVTALGDRREPDVASVLLAGFTAQTPAIRGAILEAVMARAESAVLLLDQIEAGSISAAELGPARAERLRSHRDRAIRRRAAKLLPPTSTADIVKVLATYRAVLTDDGDPHAGKQLFTEHCAACHRVSGVGVDVGPDISDTRTKTAEQLLTDVLDPNRAIDGNYISYLVVTDDGRILSGIVTLETASSITLRQADGMAVQLLRENIEQMQSNGVSLMPAGFEKTISTNQMVNLISFLKNWRYVDAGVPLPDR